MVETRVDLKEIANKAAELKKKANDMFVVLKKAQETIKNTQDPFNSNEGELMRQQFAQYSKKFQHLQDDVTEFGTYADSYAERFGEVKSKLKSMADGLPASR